MSTWRSLGRWMLLLSMLGASAGAHAKVKIAAIGASTTAGSGSSAGHSYPDELQRLLGAEYEVKNFGVGGTTLLRKGRPSYWSTPELKAALAYQPDVAFIWFGGNDSKAENWTPYKGEFLGDYLSLIRMFQALPTKPRTFVSVSVLMKDTGEIRKAVVDNEIGPLVRQAGAETGSVVIDLRSQFQSNPEYFNADGIHPNDRGTAAIAKYVHSVFLASLAAPDAGAAPDAMVAPAADAAASADARAAMPDLAGSAPDAAVAPPKDPAPRADASASRPTPEPEPEPEPEPAPAAKKAGGCAFAGGAGAGTVPWVLAFAAIGVRGIARMRGNLTRRRGRRRPLRADV
jgi:lysophospholipase L1-like esterase